MHSKKQRILHLEATTRRRRNDLRRAFNKRLIQKAMTTGGYNNKDDTIVGGMTREDENHNNKTKLPESIIGHINEFSSSTWKIEVTSDFNMIESLYDSDDSDNDDDRYQCSARIDLKLPNEMRLFYGGDPLDYIADFRRIGQGYHLYFPTRLHVVEENPYDIDFDEAIIELSTHPTGDNDGNLGYAIDFTYSLDVPDNDEEYRDIVHRIKFHTASLMEDFCRRYLQHRWRFETSYWLSAGTWRQFFGMEGEIGLIPVINTTQVRLGESIDYTM